MFKKRVVAESAKSLLLKKNWLTKPVYLPTIKPNGLLFAARAGRKTLVLHRRDCVPPFQWERLP